MAVRHDTKNVGLILAGAYDLPFTNESFDLVYMVSALPEIPNQSGALQEVKRVLKPGGTLAISEMIVDPDYPLRSTTVKRCQDEEFVLEASAGHPINYTLRFRKRTRP